MVTQKTATTMISNEDKRGDTGDGFLRPDWPAPESVGSILTTRHGGVSQAAFESFNLGDHVGDGPASVMTNRLRVRQVLGREPVWLNQVHGLRVVDLDQEAVGNRPPDADASLTRRNEVACVVMTADCLPVLFCDEAGTVVAAAHAGWRGLCHGVLEATIEAMAVPARQLMAYLGPAIGPMAFEVGDEVRTAFVDQSADYARCFQPLREGKWLADLYSLARLRLGSQGIERIFGGGFCTVGEPQRFFSYRRDGRTGRMGSFIWLR